MPLTLKDDSLMPFGAHKGKRMEEIDAKYFHWLWTNGMKESKISPVADYIRRNLSALQLEYKDGIW